MATDSDLADLLPGPPPARPAQRAISIGAAMRRFDGEDDAPRRAAPIAEPERPWWPARHQFVSLATMAVVALLSTSIWLSQGERFAEPSESGAPARVGSPTPGERETTATPEDPARPASVPAPAEGTQERQTGIAPIQTPAPAPPGDRALLAEADTSIVVQGRAISRRGFDSPSPTVTVDEEMLDRLPAPAQPAPAAQESSGSVVVTGSRIARPDAEAARSEPAERARAPRPDWNACTVMDPGRSVRACRSLADPEARGARGRAAAQLADGLTLAWEGDLDRAIEAFDRAIGTAPDLSIAYLNRGLAYQMKGDLARARADLDRAIAADPDAARGYYHRSQLRRASGDAAGADADARRSAQLDRSN